MVRNGLSRLRALSGSDTGRAAELGIAAMVGNVVALAFTLANPSVVSSLFGATRREHVVENVQAVELLDRLGEVELAELRAITGDALDGAP